MSETEGLILLLHEVMAVTKPMIEPRFETVCLWDYPSVDALLADKGDRVRVIGTHGGQDIAPALVEALPNLGLIASVGVGYDGVDVRHARSRGIEVTNGVGANTADVADVTLGLILASACDIYAGDKRLRAGEWTETYRGPRRRSMKERKVGIVGLGLIGQAVADRLVPLGCEIAWYGPRPKPALPWRYVADVVQLARDCDILVVTAPLSDETAGLINREVIEALGPDGLLVNVGRGGLVDEDALIAALKSGALGAAALDVQAEEPTPPARWRDVPNIILTPHIGGYATGGMAMIGQLFRETLGRFFAGEPLPNAVPDPR